MRRITRARSCEQEILHRHDEPQMVLILSGAYFERSFGCLTECRPGDFIVRPTHFGHGGAPGPEGSAYVRLAMSPCAARRFFAQHGWATRIGRVSDRSYMYELIADPAGGDVVVEAAATRSGASANSSTALDCIAASLEGARGPSIDALAETHGFTPWSLSRAFKARFGASPQIYRQQARLQRAIKALAETSAPLARIALDAGFADQSHFNRVLREATGLAPGAARRALAIA
jgi:AraC family transcriptional regulator